MAEQDDTSRPTRLRRNQILSAPPVLATSDSGLPPGGEPPPFSARTLEEALETVRTQLIEGRAMLHCLSEVLLYADDTDSVIHAEVAQAVARWISHSAEQLDLVKLQPLIDAIKQQGDSDNYPPYQVREPTAVYHAA
ncbi:hypothetical protein ACFPN2_16695 [Steroidobacter flavus]|uniref:Uncharacterized protein n=1 Tax=Steroidobacter flavus TaxID=1842136 RepID=A0ABV8SW16_9GAMM